MSAKAPATFKVSTSRKNQLIDITGEVSAIVRESGVAEGVCHVFVPHTTAGVTINENADPDVVSDIIMGMDSAVPEGLGYDHAEGNSPGHIKSSMVGVSETMFVSGGALLLGTWQGIYFCEFDGPRTRKVHVKVVSD